MKKSFLKTTYTFKILVFSLGLCSLLFANTAVYGKHTNKPAVTPLVETTKVKFDYFKSQLMLVGTLRASQGIILRPEVSGRITNIYFKSGTTVTANTPLIKLNSAVLEAQLQQAQSELKLAKKNYQQMASLYKSKVIAKPGLDSVLAKLDSATAATAEIQAKLSQATIIAPFDGKLGLSQVNLGDYVSAGQNLVALEAINPIEVEFSIPEIYLGKISIGQELQISVDAYPNKTFTGKIYALDATINLNNRTVAARASIPNADNKLLPGEFAKVTLPFVSKHKVLLIPQSAVIYDAGKPFVYKLNGNKVYKTQVLLGEREQQDISVLKGITTNDTVVTAGQLNLENGIQVNSSN